MKFYLLDDPAKPGEYARFSHVGTWSEAPLCENCGVTTSDLVEPLQVEWNKGTERIGGFSWCGYTCVVTDEVRSYFEQANTECSFGRVEVMQPADKVKKPRVPRVPFPYAGPRLHWLIPTKRVPLDEDRSGVHIISDCPRCGQKEYNFKQTRLFIHASAVGNISMFHIEQFGRSGATFVIEPLLAELKSRGFTNICPRLAGNII